VCSTPSERLARLRAAIDALAAQAGLPDSRASGAGQPEQAGFPRQPKARVSREAAVAAGSPAVAGQESAAAGDTGSPIAAGAGPAEAGTGPAEDIDARLARLWQMLAQLDPELARRLPRYLA
jgi:hypothetical protein